MIRVSAPGKIHLMGEHAVVYGKPALLTAIDRRLTVIIEAAAESQILVPYPPAQEFIEYTLEVVKKAHHLEQVPPFRLTVESAIPFGYHLGSSAALAVATAGAFLYFAKNLWNPIEINQLAYEVEKKQHGNPSGGDNTAVTFGGFLWYRRELEFLKSIWQLPFRPAATLNHFFLINTGKPEETTGEMVAMVNAEFKIHSSKFEKIFNENEKQTRRIAVALKAGLEHELIDAMQKGERTLEQMGVVSKQVLPLLRAIETRGGAAKILGGGGKKHSVGFLLCYHHDPDQIAQLCNPYGYTTEAITLGAEGVRLEK